MTERDPHEPPTPPQVRSRRAWAWPAGIITGLGLVVVANAIMISIALSNPSAPAAADHWAESLSWDRELELREHSAALGWSLSSLAWRDHGRDRVELTLLDADRRPLVGLRGTVTLERSDSAAHDVRFALRELGDGRYLVDGQTAKTGLVRLTLDVVDTTGLRFVTHRRLALDELPVVANLGAS